MSAHDIGADPSLACSQTLFMVKGWNRSVCCLGVLIAVFDHEGEEGNPMLEAGVAPFSAKFVAGVAEGGARVPWWSFLVRIGFRSFSTVYVTITPAHLSQAIQTNRGGS